MRNTEILEMLNDGRIDELKKRLSDEIFTEALVNSKPGAKKRYAAMKKYFGYIPNVREALQKPCAIEFEGRNYISFCNSHSIALTTESCGEMKLFDDPDRYPEVGRLIHYKGVERKVDFTRAFADAKSKGYKLKKSEVGPKFRYLMHYDGAYFKLGLIDAAFAIIDDGEEAAVYHVTGERSPITIKNNIGVCTVMPMNLSDDAIAENDYIVVEVDA